MGRTSDDRQEQPVDPRRPKWLWTTGHDEDAITKHCKEWWGEPGEMYGTFDPAEAMILMLQGCDTTIERTSRPQHFIKIYADGSWEKII